MSDAKPQTHEPLATDYLQVFREQNPWHMDGKVPEIFAPSVERPLAKFLPGRLLNDIPHRFQIVLGPRRVGKSTSMYQTVRTLIRRNILPQKIWWLRLDHPLLMPERLDALVRHILKVTRAVEQEPVFIFLDEITYAQDWDKWLKNFYDDHMPIRLVGSSSATAALLKQRSESGVGRWEEQYLTPYLFTEYLELINQPVNISVADTLAQTLENSIGMQLNLVKLKILQRRLLLTGGFPELLLYSNPYISRVSSANEGEKDDEPPELFFVLESQRVLRDDAIERSIYKDIPQAFGVGNPILLERVLYTLAGRIASTLSPQNICQNLEGLTQPTFDKYLSYLEQAYLVFTLPNYSGSEASIQKRGRKIYFVDSAVRNAALQRGVNLLHDADEMGLLLENMAAAHLHALGQQSQIRVFHWRDGNDEIDLIYNHPTEPVAFEVGSSPSHHRRGINAFIAQHPRFKNRCFLVAPNAPAIRPMDSTDGIGTLPLELFLLATGAQAERELKNRLLPAGAS